MTSSMTARCSGLQTASDGLANKGDFEPTIRVIVVFGDDVLRHHLVSLSSQIDRLAGPSFIVSRVVAAPAPCEPPPTRLSSARDPSPYR